MNVFPLKIFDALNFERLRVGHFPNAGRHGLKVRDTRGTVPA
jgi:hypothetical protein